MAAACLPSPPRFQSFSRVPTNEASCMTIKLLFCSALSSVISQLILRLHSEQDRNRSRTPRALRMRSQPTHSCIYHGRSGRGQQMPKLMSFFDKAASYYTSFCKWWGRICTESKLHRNNELSFSLSAQTHGLHLPSPKIASMKIDAGLNTLIFWGQHPLLSLNHICAKQGFFSSSKSVPLEQLFTAFKRKKSNNLCSIFKYM